MKGRELRGLTALEVLRALDDWATDTVNGVDPRRLEAQLLWDVLTAMRGPDSHVHMLLKERTTAVIRGAACPGLAMMGGATVMLKDATERVRALPYVLGAADVEKFGLDSGGLFSPHGHFWSHVQYAATALRRMWSRPCVEPPSPRPHDGNVDPESF